MFSAHAGDVASRASTAHTAARARPVLLIGFPRLLLLLETPELEILLVLLHRIQQPLGLLPVDVRRLGAAIPASLRLVGLTAPVHAAVPGLALPVTLASVRATIRA